VCDECGKQFKSEQVLLVHKNSHLKTPLPRTRAEGEAPTTKVVTPAGIVKDRRRAQETPALCPECGQQFATITVLQKHFLRKHLGGDVSNFACEKCGKAFKTRADAKQHQELCLQGVDCGKVIRCRTCQFEVVSGPAWRMHRQLTKHRTYEIAWPLDLEIEGVYGEVLDDSVVDAHREEFGGHDNEAEVLFVERLARAADAEQQSAGAAPHVRVEDLE
jgi:hypothetical protein